MKTYKIALLPGDGVGKEVIPEGMKVLHQASQLDGTFKLETTTYPWGSDYYFEHNQMMPGNALDILRQFDAIYLGAIGHPDIADHIGVGQVVFKIRQGFNQYINLRPIKLLPGVDCPLKNKGPQDIDMVFVRENTEGEYGDIGGTFMPDTTEETVMQTNIFTRKGTERAMRYAFELARKRRGQLASITKSNALKHSMVFWDKIFAEMAQKYEDVQTRKVLVDAMAMFMVTNPERFDVVVASNLFGDILTDLGAGLQGGLGFVPGANINPEKDYPSMFEPIHGSAPAIAGTGKANPMAAILTGALLLEHIGEKEAADDVEKALEAFLSGASSEELPAEFGGGGTVSSVGAEILKRI